MRFEFTEALEEEWHPVSRPALISWLGFYALFLLYALTRKDGFVFTDYVFMPIHEGGHLLFSWFGVTLGIMGGTLLQLGVPLALALYFSFQRHLTGTTFAAFFFFENFLNVATYMADARRQALPLVTVGDPDHVEHDWFFIFSKLGLIERDTVIAAVVRVVGVLGMIGVVIGFWWKSRAGARPKPET